ncbi:hypothetical protein NE237_006378 [Protea cynaroides]|uniref:Uncharacterized protein n=1 Tax=Protea cynaroides TaxID=273540 RepID=A0A9Q0KMG9_9MAGN|nr:hypothetical protein NE237_006378 [Protea cynaroides]
MSARGPGPPAAGLVRGRGAGLVGRDEGLDRIMFPESITGLGFAAPAAFSRPGNSVATVQPGRLREAEDDHGISLLQQDRVSEVRITAGESVLPARQSTVASDPTSEIFLMMSGGTSLAGNGSAHALKTHSVAGNVAARKFFTTRTTHCRVRD